VLTRGDGGQGLVEPGMIRSMQADARSQAVGLEGAGDIGQQRQCRFGLATAQSQPGEGDGGVGPSGLQLERAAQGALVPGGDQAISL